MRNRIGIVLFAVIAIGGIAGAPAKADYYGDVIRRHQDIANYNGYHARAEAKMYKTRAKAYRKASKSFNRYGAAHTRAMSSDAHLAGLEAKMSEQGYKPSKSYIAEWARAETAAVLTRRGY